MNHAIRQFLTSPAYAVAGASTNRQKFGNKVLRCYQQNQKTVYPVNPSVDEIEGLPCIRAIADLPDTVNSLSIITPPAVTEKIVEQAIAKGIRNIWMQPGAQSAAAIANCLKHGVSVIADGSCVLVELGFQDH